MYRLRMLLTLLILHFISGAYVFSQSNDIFAPYVSNIQVSAQDESILITWRKSDDIEGDLIIYRYSEEISEDNFIHAVPLQRLNSTATRFIDSPGDTQAYFYLVLGTNSIGELYRYFIPFRNASTLGIAAKSAPQEQSREVKVSGIRAKAAADRIIISFQTSKPEEELIIYRYTEPISSFDDLNNATRVDMINSSQSSYTDYPIPGITYYYTVQWAQAIKTGASDFILGENSLDRGARISPKVVRTGLKPSITPKERPRPLPYLLLNTNISSGETMTDSLSMLSPATRELSPEIQQIVNVVVSGVSAHRNRITQPHILETEAAVSSEGEQHTLSQIIKQRLLTGEYETGIEELTNFLSLRRTSEINYRGRYYLGQFYYFSGDYQNAFLEFLIAEEHYYPTVQPWIEDIYYIMRSKDSKK